MAKFEQYSIKSLDIPLVVGDQAESLLRDGALPEPVSDKYNETNYFSGGASRSSKRKDLADLMRDVPDLSATGSIPPIDLNDLDSARFDQVYNLGVTIQNKLYALPNGREFILNNGVGYDDSNYESHKRFKKLLDNLTKRGSGLLEEAKKLYFASTNPDQLMIDIEKHDPVLGKYLKEHDPEIKWLYELPDESTRERVLKQIHNLTPKGRVFFRDNWYSEVSSFYERFLGREDFNKVIDLYFKFEQVPLDSLQTGGREASVREFAKLEKKDKEALLAVFKRDSKAMVYLTVERAFNADVSEQSDLSFERVIGRAKEYIGTLFLEEVEVRRWDHLVSLRTSYRAFRDIAYNSKAEIKSVAGTITKEGLQEFVNIGAIDYTSEDLVSKVRYIDLMGSLEEIMNRPQPPATIEECLQEVCIKLNFNQDPTTAILGRLAEMMLFVPSQKSPATAEQHILRNAIIAGRTAIRGILGFREKYAKGKTGQIFPERFTFSVPDYGRRKIIKYTQDDGTTGEYRLEGLIFGSFHEANGLSWKELAQLSLKEQMQIIVKGEVRTYYQYLELIQKAIADESAIKAALGRVEEGFQLQLAEIYNKISTTVNDKSQLAFIGPLVDLADRMFVANCRGAEVERLPHTVETLEAKGILGMNKRTLDNLKCRTTQVDPVDGLRKEQPAKRIQQWTNVELGRHLVAELGWRWTAAEKATCGKEMEIRLGEFKSTHERPLLETALSMIQELRGYHIDDIIHDFYKYLNIYEGADGVLYVHEQDNFVSEPYKISHFEKVITKWLNKPINEAEGKPDSNGNYTAALPHVETPSDFEKILREVEFRFASLSPYSMYGRDLTTQVQRANQRMVHFLQTKLALYTAPIWDWIDDKYHIDNGVYRFFRDYICGLGYWGGPPRNWIRFNNILHFIHANRGSGLGLEPTEDNREYIAQVFNASRDKGQESVTSLVDDTVIKVDDLLKGNFTQTDVDTRVAALRGSGDTAHPVSRMRPMVGAPHFQLLLDRFNQYTPDKVREDIVRILKKNYELRNPGDNSEAVADAWFEGLSTRQRNKMVRDYNRRTGYYRRADSVEEFQDALLALSYTDPTQETPWLDQQETVAATLIYGCPVDYQGRSRDGTPIERGIVGNHRRKREELLGVPDTDAKDRSRTVKEQQEDVDITQLATMALESTLPAGARVAGIVVKKTPLSFRTITWSIIHAGITFNLAAIPLAAIPGGVWIAAGLGFVDGIFRHLDFVNTRLNETQQAREMHASRFLTFDGGGRIKNELDPKHPEGYVGQMSMFIATRKELLQSLGPAKAK